MPMTAGRPSTMNSSLPVEIPQNSMAVQQRLQISELQFGKFPHLQCYSCWKDKIQNPGEFLFRFFTRMLRDGSKKWDGRFSGWINPRDQLRVRIFPNIEMLDARIASALNKVIQNSYFKKKVSLEEQKVKKEDPFLSSTTDRLHDLRLLSASLVPMIQFLIMLIYSLSFFEPMVSRNSIRDGMKFYCLWPRSRLTTFWKVCTNWEFVSLINAKPYKNCTTWKFIRRYRCPIIKSWKRWWREA